MIAIGERLEPEPEKSLLLGASLALLLLSVAGPRPEWHPQILKLLVASGRFSAASAALRAALGRKRQVRKRQVKQHVQSSRDPVCCHPYS